MDSEDSGVSQTRHHYHNPYPYHQRHHQHRRHLPRRFVYRKYHFKSRRHQVCWWSFAGVVLTFMFVLLLILPLRYSNDTVRDNEGNNHIYAPTDTAIISYNHPFCDKLTVHSPDTEFFVEVNLYVLDRTPALVRQEKSTFYKEPRLFDSYEYWQMFLYPGSRVGYSVCSIGSEVKPPVKFYLVKGNRNFEWWKTFDSISSHLLTQNITALCGGAENTTLTFEVKNEDNYYFIFSSVGTSSETVTGVTFDFERTLYDMTLNNSTVNSECSVILNSSLSSCDVSVPHTSKPTVLLELMSLIPDPNEWDASIRVSVTCSARAWLYVVIALSAFVFVGLLAFSAILVYLCFCNKRSRRTSSETASQTVREESCLISEKPQSAYEPPPPYMPQ